MATVVRETERKYEHADEVELPGWNGLVGVQPVVGPEEQTLEAVYFDTEDLGVGAGRGHARRRLGGHDAGGTGVPHRSIPRARRFPGKTCGN